MRERRLLAGGARSVLAAAPDRSLAPGATYQNEMPGGQYTNPTRASSRGWRIAAEVRLMYAEVNKLFGDIVKVTPTSKAVGDMALFMVANNLAPADVLDGPRELAFPNRLWSSSRAVSANRPAAFRRSCKSVKRAAVPP